MSEETPTTSMGGCLIQLFWTLVGPGLMLAMGALLIVNQPALGTWPDFAFLGWTAAVALARFLDGRPSERRTPAASAARFKYIAVLAGAALLILAVAHFVAPRFG